MEKSSKFKRFLTRVGDVRLGQIWEKFRKPFNFCWKAGAVVFGISIVVLIVVSTVAVAADWFGLARYEWLDEDLGDGIEVRHFSDLTCAVYDSVEGKKRTPRLKWVSGVPERDSLTVFCDLNGKRGFLNVNTGKIEIKAQYRKAWHFSEGLAAVMTDEGKIGFINRDNELVITGMFDCFADHDYLFIHNKCIVRDGATGLYGAIDTLGTLKLPMEYSRIFEARGGENMLYLRKNGKCGLADADMNVIFEPEYDDVSVCPYRKMAYITLDGVKQLVSFNGEVIMPFVISGTRPMKYMVKYNESEADEYALHPYLVEYELDHFHHGVMDSRTGRVIIPAIYSDIEMISKDIVQAKLRGGGENNIMFSTTGVMIK